MIISETKRTVIREFTAEDSDALYKLLSNTKVMEFSKKGPYSRKDCEQFLERCLKSYSERGCGLYAVIYKENGELIGYSGFYIQQIDGTTEFENGYRLLPAYWGRGLGAEAASSTLNYGLSTLGFKRVISIIEPANIASIKVAEKCGMRLEKEAMLGEIKVFIYVKEQD